MCQKAIITCWLDRVENAQTPEVNVECISEGHQSISIEKEVFPISISYVPTTSESYDQDLHCIHLKKLNVFPVFADRKQTSGSNRDNNEQVH